MTTNQNATLNEQEKTILSVLYQRGASSIGDLAKTTLINRTTLYPAMNRLAKKGIVTTLGSKGVALYRAIAATEFREWLARKEKEEKQSREELLSWIDKQSTQTQNNLLTEVKYYEGLEGVMNLYDNTWRNNNEKTIYALTDYEKAYQVMGDHFLRDDYFKKRISHGVHVKSLLPKSPIGIKELKSAKKLLREMRFISLFKDLGIEMNIWDDKIAIIAFDSTKPSGVLIKNEIIAHAFKNIFQHLWTNAEIKN